MSDWFSLTLSVLATWRLCHLVAAEDGPFGAVARLRRAAGSGGLGRLMDCPYCLSLWFAAPFAVARASGPGEGVLLWLAISGGACLIEQGAALVRSRTLTVIELPMPGER